jgi:hypothetical protein
MFGRTSPGARNYCKRATSPTICWIAKQKRCAGRSSPQIGAPSPTVQTEATQVDAEIAPVDADLAAELIASGVTTQPVETVVAVLAASRDGVSINAAAKAAGINYRTAQRIVEAATERLQPEFEAVG